MATENRIATLKSGVIQLFKIATAANPKNAITLRFFGSELLGGLDDLGSEEEIEEKLKEIEFNTISKVPGALMQKILQPLATKVQKGRLEKPAIVTVLTSGGVSEEGILLSACHRLTLCRT